MRCQNPDCGQDFTPRANNRTVQVTCGRAVCLRWLKRYRAEVSGPPRGLAEKDWEAVAERLQQGEIMDTLILTARETGLRKAELLGLMAGDVRAPDGSIREVVPIRGQRNDHGHFVATKSRRPRNAFLSPACREWIAALLDARPGLTWLFSYSHAYVSAAWRILQRAAGVKNPATGRPYRFHDLRHTYALDLVRKGAIDLAREALGHSDPKTTMRYAERTPEEIAAAINKVRSGP
jgi:integrase